MTATIVDISMSLDGFIAGPTDTVANELEALDRLHGWRFDHPTDADQGLISELFARSGAIVIGRRMFDLGVGPWGDPPPFGMPVFILTNRPEAPRPMKGGTTYTFVQTIGEALDLAREAAGPKDVAIFGGARIVQQLLAAGALDELQIHLVPVLPGGGVRLFEGTGRIELEHLRTIETPGALHLRFRPLGSRAPAAGAGA